MLAQYINSRDAGGAERLVLEISNYLTKLNIKNCIFHHGNDWLVERAPLVPCFKIPLLPMSKGLTFGRAMADDMKRHGVTLLHSHLYGATLRGAIAAKFAGIPHIATQHDVYTIQDKPSRIRWLWAAAMAGTDIVTISDNMEALYRGFNKRYTHIKFPADRLHRIYNGVDTDVFHPRQKKIGTKFRLITVGRHEEVKNYNMLLQAMYYLVHKHNVTNIHLTMVGDGEQYEKIKAYADAFLKDYVSVLGARDNIPELLAEADAFVLTSKTEGLSCSILEAMATGLPIIATDVGGNSELVDDSQYTGNGSLVGLNNLVGLAKTIQRYSMMFDLAKRGEKSLALVNRKFSIEAMMHQYFRLYGINDVPLTSTAEMI